MQTRQARIQDFTLVGAHFLARGLRTLITILNKTWMMQNFRLLF